MPLAEYPAVIPTIPSNKTNGTLTSPPGAPPGNVDDHPAHHNKLAVEVVALAQTLGINPQATDVDVATRISKRIIKPTAPATRDALIWDGANWVSSRVDWAEVTGKPATFAPSAHTHAGTDITSGTVAAARLPSLSGLTVPAADVDFNAKKATNAADPTAAQHLVTRSYMEAKATLAAFGGGDVHQDHSNAGANLAIDLANGNRHSATLNTAGTPGCTITFANAGMVTTRYYAFGLRLKQDATGGRSFALPGTVTWPGGAPTFDTTPLSETILMFETYDAGATWKGYILSGTITWGDITGKPATFPPSVHGDTHASGGSDPIYPNVGNGPARVDYIENIDVRACTSSVAVTSGVVYLFHFTADRDLLISKLAMATRATAAVFGTTGPLCRLGVYTIAGNGDAALVARTADVHTTIFAANQTPYEPALDATGGYVTNYQLLRGLRYAYAVVVVIGTGGAPVTPTFHGTSLGWNAVMSGTGVGSPGAAGDALARGITGQTDLPASIANASFNASFSNYYWIRGKV